MIPLLTTAGKLSRFRNALSRSTFTAILYLSLGKEATAFASGAASESQVCSGVTKGSTTQVRMVSSSPTENNLEVAQFLCLDDNYGYLIHDPATGETAAVDTPSAGAYKAELQKRGWKLTHILNTHHHWDHVGGNQELKQEDGSIKIYGPAGEKEKIPGIDVAVEEGDTVKVGPLTATVMDVGGHTLGHIAYHFPEMSKVFVGDALFAMGCGRMFEGTPKQFWGGLQRIRALPDETVVYCAHEYTQANARFAGSVEPGNLDLRARIEEVKAKRSQNLPTVPTQIGLEKKTNPFLRFDVSPEIRTNVGATPNDSDFEVFAKVRKAKDTFRG